MCNTIIDHQEKYFFVNIETFAASAPPRGHLWATVLFPLNLLIIQQKTIIHKTAKDNTKWLWTQSLDCESSKVSHQTNWAQLSLWWRSAQRLRAVTLFRLTHVHCHCDFMSTESQEVFPMLMADTFLVSLDVWSVNQLGEGNRYGRKWENTLWQGKKMKNMKW